MTKKITMAIMFYFLLLSVTSRALAAPIYKDMQEKNYTYPAFQYLVEQGILEADPEKIFGVNEPITRIEASQILLKALKIEVSERSNPNFVDVTPEDEYYDVITTIVDEGIMSGNEKREFNAKAPLTRAQMAKILTLGFQLQGTSDYSFRDVPPTAWESNYVKAMFAAKVTTGYEDNTYRSNQPTTKSHFIVFIARILNPTLNNAPACFAPNNKLKHAVDVSVTNLWHEPNKTRPIDRPSLTKPVDMEKWTKSLTLQDKLWLVDRTDTQAIYGDEVEIVKTSGSWVRIAIKDQFKTGHPKGYEGWVPKNHITSYYPNFEKCPIAIVNADVTTLYNTPSTQSPFMKISYTTMLPVIQEDAQWLHVQTPTNGVKYVAKKDARVFNDYASVPKPSQADIVNSAKKFMRLPYLWAGTSGFGFDCSGIIYSVYKNHGILIPRDSFVQATHGKAVARSSMQPGDLMFFAYNKGRGKVYHVALYVGNGQMLHAPNSSRSVEIISIQTEPYKSNFSGARRYLP